jgi:peptidoglycan/LPS O-acetylase OafA/YrhL
LVFSWFFNNPARFSQVLSDGIWNAFFAANLNFAVAGTDYFQFGHQPSPFLHFWSLAVQEQFYFVWPPLMLTMLAFRGLRFRGALVSWQQRLRLLFLVTTIFSLVVMVVLFMFQPTITYFLTLTRGWELSIGALVAIDLRNPDSYIHRLPSWVKQLPIPLFILSLFVVREDNFGYTMPLLVIACFILVAKGSNTKDWDVRFLSSKPLTYIGDRSYSLYLWHWPILVFANELGFPDTVGSKLILLILCIALAIPSYRYVEVPFQKIKIPEFKIDVEMPIPKSIWVSGSTALVIGILILPTSIVQPASQSALNSLVPKSQFIDMSSAEPTQLDSETDLADSWFDRRQQEIIASNKEIEKAGRLSEEEVREINRVADGKSYAQGFGFTCAWGDCTLGNPAAKLRILVLGSSYSLMYAATYAAMAQSGTNLYVQMFTSPSCPNVLGTKVLEKMEDALSREACGKMHQTVLNHVSSHKGYYDFVVLSDRNWTGADYTKAAIAYANIVKSAGDKMVILGQPPTNKDLASCLNRDYSNYSECSNTRKSSVSDYRVAAGANVAFGDISDLFCLETFCPLLVNNAPTSALGHLTDLSAASIAPYYLDFLEDAKIAQN